MKTIKFHKTDCGVDFLLNVLPSDEVRESYLTEETFNTDFFEIVFFKSASLDKFTERGILGLFDASPDDLKKKKKFNDYGNWRYKAENEIIGLANSITPNENLVLTEIQNSLLILGADNNIANKKYALVELETKY